MQAPRPANVCDSQMRAFTAYLEAVTGTEFGDYQALHRFSVDNFRTFWKAFLEWSGVICIGDVDPVCHGGDCESAIFFPNLQLNYVENLLALRNPAEAAGPAITAIHAERPAEHLSRGELQYQVVRLAIALRRLGLQPGDHVAAILRNDAAGIIATLAVTALGATICVTAPDLGAETIAARLAPVAPRLLIAHFAPREFDIGAPLAARVGEVLARLPSVERLLAIDCGDLPGNSPVPVSVMDDLIASVSRDEPAHFEWPRFPFNHPLFIMFSSGTTGRAKAIVHGAGGTLIEHIKEHRLHCDLRAGEKLFFQTSPAWMMWNWQMSALASDAEIVLYDGPIVTPRTLWEIVAAERVTVFGTSPAYLRMCEDARISPGATLDIRSLRAVLSTGSVLYERQYFWVRDCVGPIPVQSISGGTDIIGCFVLGNPDLPVFPGECQSKSLGMDVRALGPDGRDVEMGAVGELVCANPFPSRPLGLLGDTEGARFHQAYFAQNPGVWTHGDLIEFTPHGSARLHGRSDGVLNVNGINVSPTEIYRVLGNMPGILEAMVVEQRFAAEQNHSRMILLVILAAGVVLDGKFAATIRRELTRCASAAHVPDVIVAVNGLPVTHNGKLSVAAVRDSINGVPIRNRDALRNPECLESIRQHPALKVQPKPALRPLSDRASLLDDLQQYWQWLFQIVPVELDDNFFALGGRSLDAAQLIADILRATGRDLPLATMLHAPTIEALADLILDQAKPAMSRVVTLRPGNGSTALIMIHSLSGTVLELWSLARLLNCAAPIYGIQASGLEPDEPIENRVEVMAAANIAAIKTVRPEGPYALGGYSFGGIVAFEMAQQLTRAGETVELVALVDTELGVHCLTWGELARFAVGWTRTQLRALNGLRHASGLERRAYFTGKLDHLKAMLRLSAVPDEGNPQLRRLPPRVLAVRQGLRRATARYRLEPYPGRVVLFRASERNPLHWDCLPAFQRAVPSGLEVRMIPGDHFSMIAEPAISALAKAMSSCLEAA